MAPVLNNAGQARIILRDAIQSGIYPVGSSLPSSRKLATQLGINRNTAAKIYQELARDHLVELLPNRPPIVKGEPLAGSQTSFSERVRSVVHPLLVECRSRGMSSGDARRLLGQIVDESFSMYRPPSVYVAECNEDEARSFAQDLTLKLGVIAQPVLLSDLHPDFPADIVVTPYFHLLEARHALGDGDQRLLGMVVTASSSDIGRVASTVSDGPIGVIAFNMNAAERLRSLLSFQIEVPMITAAVVHPETIDSLRGNVECIACTTRSTSFVRKMLSDTPAMLVHYHVDTQSINQLHYEMQRLGGQIERGTDVR